MNAPFTLHLGDSREVLKTIPDNSVDAIVCDPPYGLSKEPDMAEVLRHWLAGDDYTATGGGFMGKTWDSFVPGPAVWRECLRVLKPGGHMLAFFGSRTYDMGTLAIRLAGFEIRDQIMWVYGSGFPKSLDVSKAIDKSAGAIREIVAGSTSTPNGKAGGYEGARYKEKRVTSFGTVQDQPDKTLPATENARQWEGWGTALKPAHEPICVARKPIAKGSTVVENVLQFGTGAINIDACRVETDDNLNGGAYAKDGARGTLDGDERVGAAQGMFQAGKTAESDYVQPAGRWPANIIHDGSDEVLAAFPDAKGQQGALTGNEPSAKMGTANCYGEMHRREAVTPRGDSGSAARFFYAAKASRRDRNEGLQSGDEPAVSTSATMRDRETADWESRNGNHHPTVKPTDLMRYLCRLITPPGGVVLDPFNGSGSTGKAAVLEGFRYIGIDLDPAYIEIARARIQFALDSIAPPAVDEPAPPAQLDMFASA